MKFTAGRFEFVFPRPTLVMGIVNVTPDSFSDGGRFAAPQAAIDHARRLIDEGADLIDIGGESTRPRATPVSAGEELRRVLPVLEALACGPVPLSIDTMKPEVARKALAAGACIVNDVAASRDDPAMWHIVAEARAGYIAMHMQGTPQTMQDNPQYENVVAEVNAFFEDRLKQITAAGVSARQVVLDPGVGFGKTVEHNLKLVAEMRSFKQWGRPLLLGVSRKSFLGRVAGGEVAERLSASLACACWAVAAGIHIIRTHDVAATRQAVRTIEALKGATN